MNEAGASEAGPPQWRVPLARTKCLKQIPQSQVVDLMVVLDLGRFDEGAEMARSTVGCRLLQIRKTALHILSQYGAGPLRAPEILNRRLDVVRQIPLRLPQSVDGRSTALQTCPEDRIERQIRVGSVNTAW